MLLIFLYVLLLFAPCTGAALAPYAAASRGRENGRNGRYFSSRDVATASKDTETADRQNRGRDFDEVSKTTRHLAQRDRNNRASRQEIFDCELSSFQIASYLDPASREWRLDDAALEENELQKIIDCTADGDVLLLDVSGRLRPSSRLTIPWSLTISAAVEDATFEEGLFPRAERRTRIRCPSGEDGVFYVREADVVLANLQFEGCSFDDQEKSIIETEQCPDGNGKGALRLHHCSFSQNVLIHYNAIRMGNASCSAAELIDVTFKNNTCVGHGCGALLSMENTIIDVTAHGNHLADTVQCPGSLLSAPSGAVTSVERLKAARNRMTVLRILDGKLELRDSVFEDNSVTVGSDGDPLSTSIHLVRSSATIEGTSFRRNTARMGAAVHGTASRITLLQSVLEENSAINGAGLYLAVGSTAVISNCTCTGNVAREDGGLGFVSDSTISISDVTLSRNVADEKGGVLKVIDSKIQVQSSQLKYGRAAKGGYFALERSTIDVTDSEFAWSFGTRGSCIYLEQKSDLTARNVSMRHGRSDRYGGAVYMERSSRTELTNCSFHSNTAFSGGNVIYGESSTLVMQRTEAYGNTGARNGGVVQCTNSSRMEIEDSVFTGNSAFYGGACSLDGESSGSLLNCTFYKHRANVSGGAVYLERSSLSVQSSSFVHGKATRGGLLFLLLAQIEISNSSFIHGVSDKGGGIKCLGMSTLNVTGSRFAKNRGDKGGALKFGSRTRVEVRNCSFSRNYAQRSGGACYLDGSNAKFSRCRFSRNSAGEHGGCMSAIRDARINITDSRFVKGRGRNGGCIYGYGRTVFRVQSTFIADSQATETGGAMSLESMAAVHFFDSSFLRNAAIGSDGTGGAISIRNALLTGMSLYAQNNSAAGSGGGLYAVQSSNLSISASRFVKNHATYGGAVSLAENGTGTFERSRFESDTAEHSGGASHIWSSTADFIDCTLTGNVAQIGGGGIALTNSTVRVAGTDFVEGEAMGVGGFVEARDFSRLLISNVSMFGGQSRHGGAVSLHTSHLQGRNFVVAHCKAKANGGAVAGEQNSTVLCTDCKFEQNEANKGGAVSVIDYTAPLVAIQFGQSTFHQNRAVYGGGLHLLNPRTRQNCRKAEVNCSYVVLANTDFTFNKAEVAGGGLFSTDLRNVLINCTSTQHPREDEFYTEAQLQSLSNLKKRRKTCSEWSGNQAVTYGDDAGSYASRVQKIIEEKSTDNNETTQKTIFENSYVIKDQQSGKPLPEIRLRIVDNFRQGPAVGVTNKHITASMTSPDGFFSGAIIEELERGEGNFSRVVGFGRKGTYNCVIEFTEEGLPPFTIEVHVRGCTIGEAVAANGRLCESCSADTFNFNPEGGGSCRACPEHGSCASHVIQPLKGYWHWTPCSEHVQRCLSTKACDFPGRGDALSASVLDVKTCEFDKASANNYTEAQCREGHTGPLCGSCKASYGRSRSSLCLKCYSGFISVGLVAISGVVLLVLSGVTIRGNLASLVTFDKKIRPFASRGGLLRNRSVSTSANSLFTSSMGRFPSLRSISQPQSRSRTAPQSDSEQENCARDAEFEKWRAVELFKITLNYVQVSAVAIAVNTDWTSMLVILFEVAEYLGGVTSEAATRSVDCLVPKDFPVERSVISIVVDAFIPLAVLFLFCTFWLAYKIVAGKGDTNLLKNVILSGFAVFYISYISLTKSFVKVLSCVEVHDSYNPLKDHITKFWAVDTSIKCYAGSHVFLVATMGGPLLILYSLGFPALIAYLTMKHVRRENYKSGWIYEVAGFMYRAYNKKYVYWESVILLRKAVLAAVVVLSYPLGGNLQAVLAVLVLGFALYFHLTCRPYRKEFKGLDAMESVSLLVSLLTFQSSTFFGDDRVSFRIRIFITVCVVVCNSLLFFVLIGFSIRVATKYLRTLLDLEEVPYDSKRGPLHVIMVYLFVYQWACCQDQLIALWNSTFPRQQPAAEAEVQPVPMSTAEAEVQPIPISTNAEV